MFWSISKKSIKKYYIFLSNYRKVNLNYIVSEANSPCLIQLYRFEWFNVLYIVSDLLIHPISSSDIRFAQWVCLVKCRKITHGYCTLTSKPSQPQVGTLKPDLAGPINFDMLITKIISIFPGEFAFSSTSASNFWTIELENGRAARTDQITVKPVHITSQIISHNQFLVVFLVVILLHYVAFALLAD